MTSGRSRRMYSLPLTTMRSDTSVIVASMVISCSLRLSHESMVVLAYSVCKPITPLATPCRMVPEAWTSRFIRGGWIFVRVPAGVSTVRAGTTG